MANDTNEEVTEPTEEIEEPEEVVEEPEEEVTDWKAKARENEALAKRNAGIAKRNATKLKKLQEGKPADKKVEKEKGFDYGELAYLEVKGVTDEETISYIEQVAKDSGKNLRELFATDWFKKDLAERKETKATKDAIPTGSKRGSGGSKDSVDYWLAKGEYPEDPVLAKEVFKAKKARAKSSEKIFTDYPNGPQI